MKLGWKRQTSCQQEDNWSRGCLVEPEQPLDMDLVVLANQVLLLGREDQAGKPRQQDRHTKNSLNSEGCCRVGSVSLS